jgi:uncharacterized protein YndB with AHSA1/START domain
MMSLTQVPIARTRMLIRKPVATVFEAFVDPALTSRFWFSRGSGRLVTNSTVTWYWDMYGASAQVKVIAIEENRRILIEWPTPVEWVFAARSADATFVTITASGFSGTDDEQLTKAMDSMGGFSFLLAGCKAFLEHGVELNLSGDHHPDAWNPKANIS